MKIKDALIKLENMTIDEFENECIKAGYTPVRKGEHDFQPTDFTEDYTVFECTKRGVESVS